MSPIVEAVGVASGAQYGAADIEKAMVDAINECAAKGITDPDKIREAKLAARKKAKEAAQAKATSGVGAQK